MIDRRSITCSSISVSIESCLDKFREVPVGGCDLTLPDDRLALREEVCSPISQKTV